jgi:threonylcarbamoyladenosine tRNA methylthiotransferase MtaB
MRRRYDTALAAERLAMIREFLPNASIGTDLIAGFPGEDDAAFERTLAFVDASPITYAHVFPYSMRTGTTAAKLDRKGTEGRDPRAVRPASCALHDQAHRVRPPLRRASGRGARREHA